MPGDFSGGERNKNGSWFVKDWNATLRKLKELRHIRNQYSHEIGTSYMELFTWEDVEWLNNFYEDILNTEDPLAQYRRIMDSKIRQTNTVKQTDRPIRHDVTSKTGEFKAEQKGSARKCTDVILVAVFVISIVVIFGIVLVNL